MPRLNTASLEPLVRVDAKLNCRTEATRLKIHLAGTGSTADSLVHLGEELLEWLLSNVSG